MTRSAAVSVDRFFELSLLGLVTTGFLALASSGFLDRPTLVLTIAGLLLRVAMVTGLVRFRVPSSLVSILAIAYILFFPADLWLISRDFLTVTVHGVCFLAILRILTAQTNRDHLYTGAISLIELISAALLSVQLVFFFWLAVYVAFAIATLVSGEIRSKLICTDLTNNPKRTVIRSTGLRWRLALLSAGSAAGLLAMTAALFLLVPRTARMAAHMMPGSPRLTGFSNIVDLGGFGRIARDDRAVLHIRSYSGRLPENLRWRGSALSRFDGRRWFEPPLPGREIIPEHGMATVADEWQRSRRDGRRLVYRVDVQYSGTNTLFVAGIPEFVNTDAPRLFLTPEESLRIFAPPSESLRYEISAYAGTPISWPLTRAERRRYLQLPLHIDDRIVPLAQSWAGEGTALDRARNIEHHLQNDFRYVLDGPRQPVDDPLADFLFVRREGYCEYFASAMAVMLRTEGIPSRVATGFLNGYYNDISGLTVVRASDAHAWVEAWIDGRGWTTFDPTPAGSQPQTSALLRRLSMYSDALDHAWREWVVSYDLAQQVAMAEKFKGAVLNLTFMGSVERGSDWIARGKRWNLWILASMLMLGVMVWLVPRLWKIGQRRAHIARVRREGGSPIDASILYSRMLDRLRKHGIEKPAAVTPLEFAQRLRESERPGLGAAEKKWVLEFTLAYNAARFGADRASIGQLAALLEEPPVTVRTSPQ